MKKISLFIAVMTFACLTFAQTSAPAAAPPKPTSVTEGKTLSELLNWMLGEWNGEGVAREQEFVGSMKADSVLDDQAVMIMRESSNKPGGPAGGLKEIMVIGYEASAKLIVMTLHTSNNSTGIYTGEMKQTELVFNVANAPQGFVNRRTFKLLPDGGLSFIIERGDPGKAVGKLVEINFKKKS